MSAIPVNHLVYAAFTVWRDKADIGNASDVLIFLPLRRVV